MSRLVKLSDNPVLYSIPLVCFIWSVVLQNRIDDIRHPASHSYNGLLWFHSLPMIRIACPKSYILMNDHPARLNNHGTEELVSSEGILAVVFMIARIVAGGNQTEVVDKFPFVSESVDISNFSHQAHGDCRPNTWYGHQKFEAMLVSFCLTHLVYFTGSLQQSSSYGLDLTQKQIKSHSRGREQLHILHQPCDESLSISVDVLTLTIVTSYESVRPFKGILQATRLVFNTCFISMALRYQKGFANLAVTGRWPCDVPLSKGSDKSLCVNPVSLHYSLVLGRRDVDSFLLSYFKFRIRLTCLEL